MDELQKEINKYVARGYIVVSQTNNSAQLIKKKRFSLFWALFWLVLGIGVGLLIYIFVYMARKDQTVYLTLDATGKVKAN
jgi:uncharacterized BrkB/YihY/UPF0761 family membrane protein